MNRAMVSVCMAAYNGADFIHFQIDSILKELDLDDELIIVDDNSTDKTLSIIKSYNDERIKIYENKKNIGVNDSFAKALQSSKGTYIFMADQDDIWIPGRVEMMINELNESNGLLITGNSQFINGTGAEIPFNIKGVQSNDSNKNILNIFNIFRGVTNYYGCAMMINKSIKNLILPFPKHIESHDLWIALAANILNKNVHIDQIVLERRIHGLNASIKKRSILKKLRSRILFIFSIIEINKRRLKHKS